jgi:intein/homing endonuclease
MLLNHLRIEGYKFHASYGSYFVNEPRFYSNFTMVQFQRASTDKHLNLVKHYIANIKPSVKVPIVYEVDDLLIGIPHWNRAFEYYDQYVKSIENILRIVSGMTVSTNKLKEVYSKYNNNIVVIPNHLPKFLWGDVYYKGYNPYLSNKNGKRPRILYQGSDNHFCTKKLKDKGYSGGDFGAVLLDYIRKTTDKYQWVFMGGYPLELDDLKNNGKIEYHPWKNILEYPSYIKTLNVDLCIAPLQQNLFNESKCLAGDTLTVNENGINSIKNINDKTKKIWQENNFKNISGFIKYDNKNTIKIITKKGFEIEGTINHKIRSTGEFKMLSDLSIGDFIDLSFFNFPDVDYQYISAPLFLTKKLDSINFDSLNNDLLPHIKINERWGRFIGYVLGDGHIGDNNTLSISCDIKYDDIIKDIILFGQEIGLNPVLLYKKKEDGYTGNGVDIRFNSRNLMFIFNEKIGFKGKYGKILDVPDIILKSPKSVIKEFLRGLFETDGTVNKLGSSCSFTSKDKKLVQHVQFLLLGFKIISNISVYYNKIYNKNYYTLHLRRQACDIFFKEIGFISEKKQDKLKINIEKKHSNSYKTWELKDEIVNIEYNNCDVYDIQVPENSYYMANGIVSHNSNIKNLEYVALGVPAIYTDIEPYKNTTIKTKTDEEMISQIERLITNPELCYDVWTKDYEIVKNQLFWEDDNNVKKYINSYLSLFSKRLKD